MTIQVYRPAPIVPSGTELAREAEALNRTSPFSASMRMIDPVGREISYMGKSVDVAAPGTRRIVLDVPEECASDVMEALKHEAKIWTRHHAVIARQTARQSSFNDLERSEVWASVVEQLEEQSR